MGFLDVLFKPKSSVKTREIQGLGNELFALARSLNSDSVMQPLLESLKKQVPNIDEESFRTEFFFYKLAMLKHQVEVFTYRRVITVDEKIIILSEMLNCLPGVKGDDNMLSKIKSYYGVGVEGKLDGNIKSEVESYFKLCKDCRERIDYYKFVMRKDFEDLEETKGLEHDIHYKESTRALLQCATGESPTDQAMVFFRQDIAMQISIDIKCMADAMREILKKRNLNGG